MLWTKPRKTVCTLGEPHPWLKWVVENPDGGYLANLFFGHNSHSSYKDAWHWVALDSACCGNEPYAVPLGEVTLSPMCKGLKTIEEAKACCEESLRREIMYNKRVILSSAPTNSSSIQVNHIAWVNDLTKYDDRGRPVGAVEQIEIGLSDGGGNFSFMTLDFHVARKLYDALGQYVKSL